MADTINGRADDGEPPAARRSRQGPRRPHKVDFRLTGEELRLLDEAARQAGRARGAYAAEVVLAAARHEAPAAEDTVLREILREVIRLSGLVRRVGVNLNQAVAKLNATGQRSGDLLPYAIESLRRAERVDAVAEEIRKALR
ncbi:MAG: plasmid mobilization protein [Streptosporangiaceae bacterium]